MNNFRYKIRCHSQKKCVHRIYLGHINWKRTGSLNQGLGIESRPGHFFIQLEMLQFIYIRQIRYFQLNIRREKGYAIYWCVLKHCSTPYEVICNEKTRAFSLKHPFITRHNLVCESRSGCCYTPHNRPRGVVPSPVSDLCLTDNRTQVQRGSPQKETTPRLARIPHLRITLSPARILQSLQRWPLAYYWMDKNKNKT